MTPIGRQEDGQTEFKRAAALDDAVEALRPVVAFLNAHGGVVWFGVAERDGRAEGIEPLDEPAKKREALRDRIIDSIEPQPLMTGTKPEVQLELEEGLLRVVVSEGARGPYALRRGNAREYLLRAADRTRVLSREELRERFRGAPVPTEDESASAERAVEDELSRAPAGLTVWVALAPPWKTPDSSARAELERGLRDAALVGNRPSGWHYHSRYNELKPGPAGWVFEGGHDFCDVRIGKNGVLCFHVPLARLTWSGTVHPDQPGAAERALHPLPLVELIVSALRLSRWLLDQLGASREDQHVISRLHISPIRGWTLAPHSPRSPLHQLEGWHTYDGTHLTTEVHSTSMQALRENPDAVAWPLVRDVYEAFEFWDDAIPEEFARGRRRLELS